MEHRIWNRRDGEKGSRARSARPRRFFSAQCSTFRLTRRRGFSFVEMIIYVGLLALVLTAMVGMLIGMSRAYGYLKLSRHLESSAVTAMDGMVRDIRDAQSVNVSQSTLDASPGVLVLNTTSDIGAPQTLQFYVLNGALRVKRDGTDLGPLSLGDVTVANLVFRQMTSGISQAVKIEMTLTTKGGGALHSANFYDTAVLRDSY